MTGNLVTADASADPAPGLRFLAVPETKWECVGTLSGRHNLESYEADVFVGGILESFAYTLHKAMKYYSKSPIIAQLCLRRSYTNFD